MPGRDSRIPRPAIPLRSMVRDRYTGKLAVLISYGPRAAKVQWAKGHKNLGWMKFHAMEQVPKEEIEEMIRKLKSEQDANDLV